MGPDDISPGVLKNCAATLCIPIYHLFSLSLSKPCIPLDWKEHRIIPIYKNPCTRPLNPTIQLMLFILIFVKLSTQFHTMNCFTNYNLIIYLVKYGDGFICTYLLGSSLYQLIIKCLMCFLCVLESLKVASWDLYCSLCISTTYPMI